MTLLLLSLLASLHFDLHVCETGSRCQVCLETIRVDYAVDPARREVRMTTTNGEGKFVDVTLGRCEVRDPRNWSCQETLSRIESRDGGVRVTRPKASMPRYEFCTSPP